MRSWIVAQGMGLYIMLGITVLGLAGCIAARIIFGRLTKEAQICGTSDYPMLHYVKQKFTSYYKLGMQPQNADAMIHRYLSMHRVGLLPLNAYRHMPSFAMGGILMTGLVTALYTFQKTAVMGHALIYIGSSLVLTMGLWMVSQVLGVEQLYQTTESALNDYFQNYLKNKLDGEYGYGNPIENPSNYERALHETAAARTGTSIQGISAKNVGGLKNSKNRNGHIQSDAVDAKIVEDVLKEFLS